MPAFEYTALNRQGKQERGVLEGDTAKQVRQLLRDSQLSPLSVEEVSDKVASSVSWRQRRQGLSASELALITRQIATLTRSGSPLEAALGMAAKQAEKRHVKRILHGVRSKVMEGHGLAEGMAEFPQAFDELYRATISAGEQSGHLDTVLERLADYTETRQEMQQKMQQALIYPFALLGIAVLVLTGLLTYVVPKVVQVFDNIGQQLPLLTRIVIGLSDFLRAWWWALASGIGFSSWLWNRLLRQARFKHGYHAALLRLPFIGRLVRGVNAARFSRTLSILVASGVPILNALKISAEVILNLPMRDAVEQVSVKVREGASIHQSLEDTGYFPPMTVYLIASGEGSGELENMLERAAQQQERESTGLISTAMALFEPVMIVGMGIMVFTIVLSILLPIFQLNKLMG